MGYRNDQIGYPKGALHSRSIIKKNEYALIDVDGTVKNTIPGFENCDITILASPKIGASFVDYVATVHPGGGHKTGFGGNGVECLLYVFSGELHVKVGGATAVLTGGGYAFSAPSETLCFENKGAAPAEIFLYKRRYKPAEGVGEPNSIIGNAKDLEAIPYEGMKEVSFYNFLPTDDLAYDMNFHILTFEAGASHGYVETHVQEHGAYVYSGAGMYNLGNDWMPVVKGDYIFMDSYVQQAAYGTSTNEPFAYVYSKDCNRDEDI